MVSFIVMMFLTLFISTVVLTNAYKKESAWFIDVAKEATSTGLLSIKSAYSAYTTANILSENPTPSDLADLFPNYGFYPKEGWNGMTWSLSSALREGVWSPTACLTGQVPSFAVYYALAQAAYESGAFLTAGNCADSATQTKPASFPYTMSVVMFVEN